MEEALTWFEIRVKHSHLLAQTRLTHRFGTWAPRPELQEVAEACETYAEGTAPHPFITLSGPVGTGKTHLAQAIAWNWMEHGKSVCYWRVPMLLSYLKSGFGSYHADREQSDTWKEINFMSKCSLLVLDDIGAQADTDWSWEQLDSIIDARYSRSLHLVATMNVGANDLPQRVYDRLREGQVFVLEAASYRGVKGIGVK